MEKYTLYCTAEQTKKAFELGAPIVKIIEEFSAIPSCYVDKSNNLYEIPTAEQMIGWLESISTIQLQMEKQMNESGTRYRIWVRDECKPFSDIIEMHNYSTRKEATLAAIDSALEYLTNNKK